MRNSERAHNSGEIPIARKLCVLIAQLAFIFMAFHKEFVVKFIKTTLTLTHWHKSNLSSGKVQSIRHFCPQGFFNFFVALLNRARFASVSLAISLRSRMTSM